MSIRSISEGEWQALVERAENPVLVEFMSPTCTICAAMAPYVERIAEKFKGKAEFFRVNAMNDRSLAMRFGVMGTPSFLMLCKGTPIASQVGGVYPALLERMVQEAIDHGSECAERQTRFSYEITGYG